MVDKIVLYKQYNNCIINNCEIEALIVLDKVDEHSFTNDNMLYMYKYWDLNDRQWVYKLSRHNELIKIINGKLEK